MVCNVPKSLKAFLSDLVGAKSIVRIITSLAVLGFFFQRISFCIMMLTFHCVALCFIELHLCTLQLWDSPIRHLRIPFVIPSLH
jgi:hypothetical protein